MSSSLVAFALAGVLAAAVVVIGLRRNLSQTTREGLPEFGGDPEGVTTNLDLYQGEERPRGPLSRRQQLSFLAIFLIFAIVQIVDAILSADDRLQHLAGALLVLVAIAVNLLTSAKSGFFRSRSRKSAEKPN